MVLTNTAVDTKGTESEYFNKLACRMIISSPDGCTRREVWIERNEWRTEILLMR
jgi:hypothetical protein